MEKSRVTYDFSYLTEYCNQYNIILNKDYSQVKVNRETIVHAKCIYENCLENVDKNLRQLCKIGCYCRNHVKILRIEKVKQSNIKKFGVEYPAQSEVIREKMKETTFKNFGVYNASQSEEIKNKKVETCLLNLGVKHSFQSEKVKQKTREKCIEKYGVEYSLQSKECRDKGKITCLEKYGVENALQSKEIRDKIKQTCLIKFGVEYPSQNEQVRDKMKSTCLINHGVEYALQSEEIKKKTKETCMIKYGVNHPAQNEEVHKKMEKTCLEKYGVKNPTQNSEISERASKNSYLSKIYTFPSGKEINVQGYEPFALDKLIQTLSEDDIITGCSNVPNIAYADEEGKQHKHFPDIFIPSQNKCIEVKSTWTAEKKKDNIFLKQNAGKQIGYNYEIWVYNRKYEKINCYI